MEVLQSAFLGDLISTGQPCPCSGWWVCAHTGEVLGSRRRHFERGQLMPAITLVQRGTWWQRLLRRRPQTPASTVWTLVEYDDLADTVPAPVLEAMELMKAA